MKIEIELSEVERLRDQVIRIINRNLSTRNDNQSIQIRRLKADAETQMEAVAGLERKVRRRTIVWFTVGAVVGPVIFLIIQYLGK